jgi:hypothetical protein
MEGGVTTRTAQTGLRRLVLIAATAGALSAGVAQAAQTLGPVTDDIGVVRIPKGAPIQIGGMWVLSGPDTALGLDQKRAVEIAIKDVGGKLLGHPLKLNAEDDPCATPRVARPRRPSWRPTRRPWWCLARPARRRDAGRADPVAGRHHRHLHILHRAGTDRGHAQARVRRLRPHRLQRQRAGQGRRHLCRQGAEAEDRRHHP